MSKINWPLNEPIKMKKSKIYATVYAKYEYALYGRIGSWPTSWNLDGSHASDCYSLIPPTPARQYGYVILADDNGFRFSWHPNCCTGEQSVKIPIPRPGEELCVRPSREAVRKALVGKMIGYSGDISRLNTVNLEDAIMALLDECC